ncbi:MAG TPA: copper resistance CopC family protein [Steroidobacteraceae bacterium]|nr:copper resistance CopC family protein [Steroidobacteraceae bacterium]
MKHIAHTLISASLLLMPLSALAHAHLEKSDPADKSTLTTSPDHFTLVFSESAHLTSLTLQKDGSPAPRKITGLPQAANDHFTVAAPKLGAGAYTLRFRSVATDDNHVSSGAIRFTVAPGARAATTQSR